MWTVILHFGRGHSEIFTDLTRLNAQEMISVAVFHNKDCVNANVFLQTQEDLLDQPDYPTE